jgi:hypothetical protein
MATIYTSVDVDVEIEIDEFVDSCSPRDMKSLINYLQSEGHLGKFNIKDESKMTGNEIEFRDKMSLLSDKFYQMTIEELEFIETLYNKYQ